MQPRHFEAIVFSAKVAVSAVASALVYRLIPLPGAPWVASISAVLVVQTSLHSSLKASLMRVVANLAGAFGGAALSILLGQPLAALAAGVMLAGLVCHLLNLDDLLRPAFVAVVLVTLFDEADKWHTSLNLVAAVVLGCLCALVVGFLIDKLSGAFKLWHQEPNKTEESAE